MGPVDDGTSGAEKKEGDWTSNLPNQSHHFFGFAEKKEHARLSFLPRLKFSLASVLLLFCPLQVHRPSERKPGLVFFFALLRRAELARDSQGPFTFFQDEWEAQPHGPLSIEEVPTREFAARGEVSTCLFLDPHTSMHVSLASAGMALCERHAPRAKRHAPRAFLGAQAGGRLDERAPHRPAHERRASIHGMKHFNHVEPRGPLKFYPPTNSGCAAHAGPSITTLTNKVSCKRHVGSKAW